MRIPFNRPYMTGKEIGHIVAAHAAGQLAGDGKFSKQCAQWLEQKTGARKGLLTHSCTAALEMAAMLIGIRPGDEVIMPSFTFVSTANAFVLRGGVPVFVDIRPDTLNLDEQLIEAAITTRTRAIVVVHYAGISCEMESIMALAKRHRLIVIEDAAHALLSAYHGRPLGGIAHLAALSFHETKNIISGEGGALLINDPDLIERAEVLSDKGTNRGHFSRGLVDKYTWLDIGSSFRPGELVAAFLWAQMEAAMEITSRRRALWARYQAALQVLQHDGRLRCPVVPEGCFGNGHLYAIILPNLEVRSAVIARMSSRGIQCVFHYVPLHDAPAGRALARTPQPMPHTQMAGECLLRLPLWVGLEEHQEEVIHELTSSVLDLC